MSVQSTTLKPSQAILEQTATLRERLLAHPIYESLQTQAQLRVFMKHHSFAVLDFMWLLKRLQQDLCPTQVPWTPPRFPALSRFVNEIVLGEESDEDRQGDFCSHYELYLAAMKDVGADRCVMQFADHLHDGRSPEDALDSVSIADSVREFVSTTHRIATFGTSAEVAAAFCFGREDIIPLMFQRLLDGFCASGLQMPQLSYYIERHIELDGDHHGPLALQMVDRLCDNDQRTAAAIAAASESLEARIRLWDGVLAEL